MNRNDLLFEYNRQKTAQNWGQKIVQAAKRDISNYYALRDEDNDFQFFSNDIILDRVLNQLESADPTTNKQYVQTLAKWYTQGATKMEDLLSRGADCLEKFELLKRRNLIEQQHRDIGLCRTFLDFQNLISNYEDILRRADPTDNTQSRVLYDDDTLTVVIPLTMEASQYFGHGTNWCTASSNYNRFYTYTDLGPLYIILIKHARIRNEKYQFHFEEGEFKDQNNQDVNLFGLAYEYPQLRSIFKEQAKKHKVIGLMYDVTPQQYSAVSTEAYRSFNIDDKFKIVMMQTAEKCLITHWKQNKNFEIIVPQDLVDKARGRLVNILEDSTAEQLIGKLLENSRHHRNALYNENEFYDLLNEAVQDTIRLYNNAFSDAMNMIDEHIEQVDGSDSDVKMEFYLGVEHDFTERMAPYMLNILRDSVIEELDKITKTVNEEVVDATDLFKKRKEAAKKKERRLKDRWGFDLETEWEKAQQQYEIEHDIEEEMERIDRYPNRVFSKDRLLLRPLSHHYVKDVNIINVLKWSMGWKGKKAMAEEYIRANVDKIIETLKEQIEMMDRLKIRVVVIKMPGPWLGLTKFNNQLLGYKDSIKFFEGFRST